MTYIVKTRGAGGLLVAEYRCPTHGVFEATVERDANGDAPDEMPCPAIVEVHPEVAAAIVHADELDARLATGLYCATDDEIAPHRTPARPNYCGLTSPWTCSAPKPKVWSKPATAAIRGGDLKDRPPGMLDTRPLAEGMPYGDWHKKQADAQRARRHQELIDKGITQKKITVSG